MCPRAQVPTRPSAQVPAGLLGLGVGLGLGLLLWLSATLVLMIHRRITS